MGFPNAIVVANDKGGVGKTATVGNLAGLAAINGLKTLAVDLDAQGNLASDFGLRQRQLTDDGRSLLDALTSDVQPQPIPTGRDRLELVSAGRHTLEVEDVLRAKGPAALYWALAPLLPEYDLVILDAPPKVRPLLLGAMAVADHLLVPLRSSAKAFDGLVGLSELFLGVRDGVDSAAPLNPDIEIVGVFLHGANVHSPQKLAWAKAQLRAEIGDSLPLETVVRYLDKPVIEMEEWGELAHEYEAALHGGRLAGAALPSASLVPAGARRAPSISGLAQDYQSLFDEVVARMAARPER